MLLVPDKIFFSIGDISPDVLRKANIDGLVLDIDHTLVAQDEPLPSKDATRFITALQKANVRLFILSNNGRSRVQNFAEPLGLRFISFALKPIPRAFHRAVRDMGVAPERVAVLGDQIFTDVLGAHMAGLKAWLVSPVGPPGRSTFYRLRRHLEKRYIHRYYVRKGE